MRLHARFAIISALLLGGAGFCQLANSQTKPAKRNEAIVSGKVTIKGKPAPGVVVGMRRSQSPQFNPTLKATTDQEGNYRVSDLPTGSYLVAPIAPAFVVSDENNPNGQIVVITEGETVEGIDFELVRGGVITGKVTDADGHPIIEERINLLSIDQRNQNRPDYSYSSRILTDDQGVYRMFGIRPGQYKVSVSQESGNVSVGVGRGHAAFRTTFYPDATDPAKAAVVEVDEGTEATKIDITLSPTVSGFSAKGRVVDESGKPVPNMSIGLSRIVTLDASNSSSSEGPTGALSDKQGEFRLQNLPPGKYSILIYPSAESDLRTEPNTFEVIDQDVTGLLIKCSSAAGLSGVVVLEGSNSNSAAAKFSQLFIGAAIYGDSTNPAFGRSSWIKSDGSFRIGGFPSGTAKFWLGGDAHGGLAITRIERDGVVHRNGIQIKNGEQVTGIRVVVVQNNGAIRGVVKMENGTWPSSGRLFIQLSRQGDSQDNMRTSEPDSRGHFLIEGLAAGNYDFQVTAYVPESRHRPIVTTQVVTVAEGLPTDVTATIDLNSLSNPNP
jgi:Carboxypeptidase regulatory-like domain/Dioxygenase